MKKMKGNESLTKENSSKYYVASGESSYNLGCDLMDKIADVVDKRNIVFVCIGSDRATGDCLGPLVGSKLIESTAGGYSVYGTLENPVHAKNLEATMKNISDSFENPFIIAIDASLGRQESIGCVGLHDFPLRPGVGVGKDLPWVGDLSITGVVNLSGLFDEMLLQTTRLNIVMNLANCICDGIEHCFKPSQSKS